MWTRRLGGLPILAGSGLLSVRLYVCFRRMRNIMIRYLEKSSFFHFQVKDSKNTRLRYEGTFCEPLISSEDMTSVNMW
jgi:hypothetical protein